MDIDSSNLDYTQNYRAVRVKWVAFRVASMENSDMVN